MLLYLFIPPLANLHKFTVDCRKDAEVAKSITPFGTVVHSKNGSHLKINRRIVQAHGLKDSQYEYMRLTMHVMAGKDSHIEVVCASCLTVCFFSHGVRELKKCVNALGTKCFSKIIG